MFQRLHSPRTATVLAAAAAAAGLALARPTAAFASSGHSVAPEAGPAGASSRRVPTIGCLQWPGDLAMIAVASRMQRRPFA